LCADDDTSLTDLRVIRVLQQVKLTRGLPQMIRVANGPEFIFYKLDHYYRQNYVTLVLIEPGKPIQNAFIERCNGNICKELLSAYDFQSLSEVREKIQEWVTDYNENRPYNALNYLTPKEVYDKHF
jgi:putative transposase